VAVLSGSDDGRRFLTADGQVVTLTQTVRLNVALAAGRTPLGYAITGDGQYGLVYSVNLSGEGDTQVASDAQISVIDLRGSFMPNSVLSTQAMTAPVGCGSPRAVGETCMHQASLAVDPQSRMVLVLGPRGVEVVALPDAVRRATSASASRVKALPEPPASRGRSMKVFPAQSTPVRPR
jgi:hypothetical protein